jgi:membrane-associated phospholipid phosphatase
VLAVLACAAAVRDLPAEETGARSGGEGEADAPVAWAQLGRDFRYLFGRPANLDARGWSSLGWTIGAGASLYLVRDEARDAVQRNRSASLDHFLENVHDAAFVAIPLSALGFYLTGAARGSAYDRETSMLLLESLAYSSAIAEAGRFVVATDRPEHGDRIRFFKPRGHSVSGDVTAVASMLAPIIDRHLRVWPGDGRGRRFWKRFGAWGMYGTAGLVGYHRMNFDRHWLPDVYFGYLNGLCVGRILVDAHRGGRDRPRRVEITPAPGGIAIRWGASPPPLSEGRWSVVP